MRLGDAMVWNERRTMEGENEHLLVAVLGSLAIHLFFLVAVSYGKAGLGVGLHPGPMPRLEVSFAAPAIEFAKPTAESGLKSCVDCAEAPRQAVAPDLEREQAALLHYWPLNLLDKPPRALEEIDLNSAELDAIAVNGKIELTAFIDAGGHVDDVQVTGGDAASDTSLLGRMLVERFRNAHFSPGEVKGRPVATAMPIIVVIEPR